MNTRNLECDLTGYEVAAAARITVTAMSAVPPHADALAWGPVRDAVADPVNDPRDLVSRDSGVLNTWPRSLLGHGVAVADTASLNLNSDGPGARPWDLAFNEFKRSLRTSGLNNTHFHRPSYWVCLITQFRIAAFLLGDEI